MMRKATYADAPTLKKIWKDIFGDTDNFINWFFSTRFTPDMSFICEDDGEIACVIHTYPIILHMGNKKVTSVMVSGVATLPKHRKKGLMHSLFKYALDALDKMGFSMCFYYPANPDYYKGLGHVHITDILLVSEAVFKPHDIPCCHSVLNHLLSADFMAVYNTYAQNFSGTVHRNDSTKMQEYLSENLPCVYVTENGTCTAYAIYYQSETHCEIQEVAGSFPHISAMLSTLPLPVKGKLPANFPTDLLSGKFDKATGNMGSIFNVSRFLAETCFDCPLTVQITDNLFQKNNGTFDFKGVSTNKKADVTLTSGELLQTVSGYKVHPALKDYFEEYNCFSLDLY